MCLLYGGVLLSKTFLSVSVQMLSLARRLLKHRLCGLLVADSAGLGVGPRHLCV